MTIPFFRRKQTALDQEVRCVPPVLSIPKQQMQRRRLLPMFRVSKEPKIRAKEEEKKTN